MEEHNNQQFENQSLENQPIDNSSVENQQPKNGQIEAANETQDVATKKSLSKKMIAIGAAVAVVLFAAIFVLVLALKSPAPYDEQSGITVSVPSDSVSLFQKAGLKLQVEEQKKDTPVYAETKELLASVGSDFVLYDLELLKNGKEVEFDGNVTVSAPIPEGFNPAAVKVYHVADDNTYEEVAAVLSEDGRTISFEVSHFSYYALVQAHTVVIDAAKNATCTETGLTEGSHCSICGQILVAQSVIPATGHTYATTVTVPTCTAKGYTTYTCSCGDTYTADEIAPLAHSYAAVVTAPTCTAKGYTTYTCSCGDTYNADEVAMIAHAGGAATCTAKAICSNCNTAYGDLAPHDWAEATCTVAKTCKNCPATEGDALGHDYETVVTVPTCTAKGYTTYTCHCGDTYVADETAALGHTGVTDVAKAPTCEETGLTEGSHCAVCNDTLVEQTVVPAIGHTMGDWVVTQEPTETAKGEKRRDCANCDHFETGVVAELAHDHSRYDVAILNAVAPTCTATGLTEGKKCSGCGETLVAQEVISAIGHSMGDWVVIKEPTETAKGEKRRDCANCDHFETDVVAELAHDHSRYDITILNAVAPTCTATGLTEGKKCSGCGETLVAQTVVPAIGHTMGDWVVTQEPTETAKGEKRRDCANCDHFETDVIAELEHDHSRWEQTTLSAVASTCTTTGLTEGKKCSGCGETLIAQEIIPATGHDHEAVVTVPTCTAKGYTTYTCHCGDSYVADEVAALGHSYNNGVITTEPTCTEKGVKTFTCGTCGDTYTEEVDATGHDHDAVVTASTCTAQGYTTYTCHCGDSYVADETAALGHTAVTDAAIDATCTIDGKTEGKHCSVCNEVLIAQETIPASGHNYESVVTAPTCTTDGYTTYTCHCGDTYTADEVVALGHTEVTDEAVDATCTADGKTEGKHCSVCNEVLVAQETIPASGHEKVITEKQLVPTCDKEGLSEGSYCSVCGTILSVQEVLPARGYDWMLEDGEFKILLIGNSFSEDASNAGMPNSQMLDILQAMLGEDVKITVGLCYSGGKGLNWHATQSEQGNKSYSLRVISTETGKWKSYGSYTSADALMWTDWDVVSLQHYDTNITTGKESNAYPDQVDPKFEYLQPATEFMLDYVYQYAPDAAVYFYMLWARAYKANLNESLATYNKMAAFFPQVLDYLGTESSNRFQTIIPVGLSMQNARTTYLSLLSYNNAKDIAVNMQNDPQIGLQRDGGHLSFNIGRYIAALTFAEMIIPDALRVENYQIPDIRETESIGVLPKEYSLIAQMAVRAAVESWREGDLTVTVLEGYEKDPTTVFAEQFANGLSFACDSDINTIPKAIEDLINAQLVDDLVIEKIEIPEEIKQGEAFVITVEVRFGYTTLEFEIEGIFAAHVTEIDQAVSATCTTTGLTEGKHCSVCNEVLVAQETISASGHNYESVVTAPTCTTDGYTTYTCHCGDTYTADEVTTLGHTEVIDEAVAKTCTTDGLTQGKHCSVCDEVLVAQEVLPACHEWKAEYGWDKGVHWQICSVCDGVNSQVAHTIGSDGYCTVCDNPIAGSDGVLYFLSADGTYAEVIDYVGDSTRVVIAEEYEGVPVTHISSLAFEGKSLTSVIIPDSVTNIGISAFKNCKNLSSITLPFVGATKNETSNTHFGYIFGASSYSNNKSYVPTSLKNVIITSGTNINGYAFNGCSSLASVTIGNSVTSIDNYAFSGCSSLASIVIPDSVMSIGSNAFYNCTTLTSITIPDSVTNIGNYAFRDCTSLTSIVIPDSVTSISSYAFYNCTSLTSITIPDSVTNIGKYAFSGCSSLTSIVIPDSVTSIGSDAFRDCTSLTSIVIPDSVTSISSYAFYNCTSLTSITIPDSVTNIGNYAFSGCSSLTSIVIPDSVTSIGSDAFYNCTSLTSITIPDNVTSIGSSAFKNCSSLASIVIPDNVTSIGSSAFKNCSSLASIAIPDSVTSIGYDAFLNCTSLTSVAIGNRVTSIGTYAFEGCSNLASIVIPDSVTSIGSYAFNKCVGLENVTIGDGVTSITSNVFKDCTNLINVTIGNNVNYIDSTAFSGCAKVVEKINGVSYIGSCVMSFDNSTTLVAIREGTTLIQEKAFSNCTKVRIITIPDTVKYIGSSAFYGCTELVSITIPSSVISVGTYAFYGCASLTSVTIPDSLTKIESYIFYNCSSLTSVTIPDSVTVIGSYVFYGCSSLESITLPFVGSSKTATSTSSSTLFGYIFGSSSYTGGTATEQYYSSNNYATYYIPATLKSVTITGGNILYGAFYNCSSLTSVTIGNSVTSISTSAFYGCTSLVCNEYDNAYYLGNENNPYLLLLKAKNLAINSCDIHYDTRFIYSSAFSGCKGLTNVTISESVTDIGVDAFLGCYKLVEVINKSKFDIIAGSTNYSYVAYYAKEVHNGESKIVNKDNYLFYTYDDINYCVGYVGTETELTLPEDYSGQSYEIYKYAFSLCDTLTSVTIPDSVTNIGSSAFYGCSSLESITLPFVGATKDGTSNTHFGYIFGASLSQSNSTYIPESLSTVIVTNASTISRRAFYECSSLKHVTIGDSVTTIETEAFYGCSNLVKLTLPFVGVNRDSNAHFGAIFGVSNSFEGINPIHYHTSTFIDYGHGIYRTRWTTYAIPTTLIYVTITDDASISENAFFNCTNLISVTLPDVLVSIASNAFNGCGRLVEIYNLSAIDIKHNVLDIHSSLQNKSNLFIDEQGYVFYEGTNIYLLGYIGDSTSLELPSTFNGNTYAIYSCAFFDNDKIVTIVIPEGITIVGGSAFYDCDNLTSVGIGNSVTKIGNYAFYHCSSLSQATLGSSITDIGNYAFYRCSYLREIIIGDNVTRIGANAFEACTNLSLLTIGKNVNSIEDNAFAECESLTYVVLPESVISIGSKVFYFCDNLTTVIFHGKITIIPEYTFWGCDKLTTVNIPETVTQISDSVFMYCDDLRYVCYEGSSEQWSSVSVGQKNNGELYGYWQNGYYIPGPIHFYSEEQPTNSGQYWYYSENYEIIIW